MKYLARTLSVLAAPLILGVLSACAPSSKSPSGEARASLPASGQSLVYSSSDYSEPGRGVPGGTLRVSTQIDTNSLDFHAISYTNVEWLGRMFFDYLVYLDPSGKPSPWLAKSWDISADGLTYTFHLRDDVTFSDGTKFNAEAVLLNLDHMRDPETKSPLAAAYIAPYLNGEVVDEYTFRAHLREPYTPFLNVLAQSWLAMYSPKALRENLKTLADRPVGSGPYILESYSRQQGLRAVKRPDYNWSPPVVGHSGAAYLDRIEVDFIPEDLVRYSALSSGQYDLTIDAPAQNVAAIRASQNLVVDNRVRTGSPTRGLTFNTQRAPFDDVRVRVALARSVDREGVGRILGFGEFRLKTDFLASNTRFYDPSFQGDLAYDSVAANKLLDEAGWTGRDPDGIRTKQGHRLTADFLSTDLFGPPALPVALQSDFRKVGFDLKIVSFPLPQLIERYYSGNFQCIEGGYWHTNTPDVLYILYYSGEITDNHRIGQNSSHLHDSKIDELVLKARGSSDPAELQSLYSQAQRRLVELAPDIPLYENHTIIAYRRGVHVLFDTSHNTVFLPSVWLDPASR
jgi:peptide/nickel transport system substrate-binding protein